MPNVAHPAPNPVTEVNAYIQSLFDALGARDPLEVLRQTPDAMRLAVDGVSPEQLSAPEAPGKWSMLQVVQHLADSELVGGVRFRMVLAQDRPALAGYDQNLWASRLRYQDAIALALEQFASLRRVNVHLLESATPAERERVGLHVERGEESLGKMIRMYAGHDVVHLRQLARIHAAVMSRSGTLNPGNS